MSATDERPEVRFEPQAKQAKALQSPADIVIFGGAAGGGKTWTLLYEPTYHIGNPRFGAVLFRRTYPQITQEGGLWEESEELYPYAGATPSKGRMQWTFPTGATVTFRAMEHEDDRYMYDGAQIAFIGFDQLESFCLTADHDVLTRRGWIPIAEVKADDKVFSCTAAGRGVFRRLNGVHKFAHSGTMVEVSQRNGVSFKATKDHRVLVKRQDKKESVGFVEAARLLNTIQVIPRTRRLDRKDYVPPVKLKKPSGRGVCNHRTNWAEEIPVDDYLELLGWYLAEGCSYSNGGKSPQVLIAQKDRRSSLDSLFGRLPFRFKWRKLPGRCGCYTIFSRQLHDHFKPFGNLYEKRVPRWVFERCSARQIRLLLGAFFEGDGWRGKTGAWSVGLANQGLRDDLQEACCLAGLVATAGKQTYAKPSGLAARYWDESKGPVTVYTLSISKDGRSDTMVKPRSCRASQFEGEVYCLSVDAPNLPDFTNGGKRLPAVPGGNFLIRRNGRVCFTGNTEKQFFYMLSRNRSTSGVRPCVRATCNPKPGWLADFLQWWWDPRTGYAIPERSGVLRWFVRVGDSIRWFASKADAQAKHPALPPKSVTFIFSKLSDNEVLMRKDPGYLANLMALPLVDRERLLGGNWKIEVSGNIFKPEWWRVVPELPPGVFGHVRFWDKAATAPEPGKDPDWTVGVAGCKDRHNNVYIYHVRRFRGTPLQNEINIEQQGRLDGPAVRQCMEQEGGASGKSDADHYSRNVLPFASFTAVPARRNKVLRWGPLSAAAERGRVFLVASPGAAWVQDFVDELAGAKGEDEKNDQADAASGMYEQLFLPTGAWSAGDIAGASTGHEPERGTPEALDPFGAELEVVDGADGEGEP